MDRKDIKKLLKTSQFSYFKIYHLKNITNVNSFSDKDNLIIRGDNLIALHKLESRFKGKIKLIYIDVLHTREMASLTYNDTYSRHQYLLMLKSRIEVATNLLRNDGSIFIHCCEREQAYIKVLSDEILGEENFVNQIVWRKSESQQNREHIVTTEEYIIVYAKNRSKFVLNRRTLTEKQLKQYKYEDDLGKFRIDKIEDALYDYYQYTITTATGISKYSRWKYPLQTYNYLLEQNLIYWSKDDTPYEKVYLKDDTERIVDDLGIDIDKYGSTTIAKKELRENIDKNNFTHPKSELLL